MSSFISQHALLHLFDQDSTTQLRFLYCLAHYQFFQRKIVNMMNFNKKTYLHILTNFHYLVEHCNKEVLSVRSPTCYICLSYVKLLVAHPIYSNCLSIVTRLRQKRYLREGMVVLYNSFWVKWAVLKVDSIDSTVKLRPFRLKRLIGLILIIEFLHECVYEASIFLTLQCDFVIRKYNSVGIIDSHVFKH